MLIQTFVELEAEEEPVVVEPVALWAMRRLLTGGFLKKYAAIT